tara:strand:+ start:36195 stop:36461 length:267 start_codon:yes stop_codon:yes gene_type:complete
MITKEQYLRAVDIIELYNTQKRILIDDVIDHEKEPNATIRLINSLISYKYTNPDVMYLDEINIRQIKRFRNFGNKSYIELLTLMVKNK